MHQLIRHNQAGQTLIETIIAIFILTVALTTGLGLAIYAFSTSSTSQNEIVAATLAREGVEVIRMMRDTNWLAGDAAGGSYALTNCADISSSCYPQAFAGPTYNFTPFGSSSSDTAGFRQLVHNATNTWTLNTGSSNYNLYLQADGSYLSTVNGTSIFARKIDLVANTSAPYTAANPQIIVLSTVGWIGKNCTAMISQDPSTTNCKVVVEEHLTNWKDYK